MNRKLFLSLLFFSSIAFFLSCKKADFVTQPAPTRDFEKEFFDTSQTTNPTVLRVIEKIKSENEKYHFAKDFISREGFAKWSRAVVHPRNSGPNLKDNADDPIINDTLILIPIIPDQLSFVKDILSLAVSGDSIYAQLIKSSQYKNYGYEANGDGKPTAKDVSFMFMMLEKSVFDKSFFDITDVTLAQKMFGDDVTAIKMHAIIDIDNGDLSVHKVGDDLMVGVTMISYLPGGVIVDLDWLLMQLSMGSGGGGPIGGGPSGTAGLPWWAPSGPSGGPGGGGSSGQNGGNNPPDSTGWQTPPCGIARNGNIFYRYTCPPDTSISDTTVKQRLHDDQVSLKHIRDSIWNLALNHNIEYFFYGVENASGVVDTAGVKTDSLENEVTGNRRRLMGHQPALDYHTHQDLNPLDRHPQDPGDVHAGNAAFRTQGFRSYVDCGDTLYAIVTQNLAQLNTFLSTHNLPDIHETWATPINAGPNRRSQGLMLLLQLIGTTDQSGLGLYETTDPEKTHFIKIN